MNIFNSLNHLISYNSPANIITLVVPSPTSLSCDFAASAKLFAAGYSILII